MAPGPSICFLPSSYCGCDFSPGYNTHSTFGCDSRNAATLMALCWARSMRIASVFKPLLARNAWCGSILKPMLIITYLSSSKRALSLATTIPPTISAWPLINLVIECKTISAPNSIGLCRYGLQKVLSTQVMILCFLARSHAAFRSVTPIVGLAGVSR